MPPCIQTSAKDVAATVVHSTPHLSGVGDQEDDHVGLGDDIKHLAKGSIGLSEAHSAGLLAGGGVGAQADHHLKQKDQKHRDLN